VTTLSEPELFQAYGVAQHVDAPHELRRAWQTAKTLAEQLEVANLPVEHRIVLHVREELFKALMAVEGYVEVET
jgi:hypothetical protein